MKKHMTWFKLLITLTALLCFSVISILPVNAEETNTDTVQHITVSYSSVTIRKVVTADIPYSDAWFSQSATIYNHQLAQASMGFAAAAFRPSVYDPTYSEPDTHVKEFLTEAGFSDIYTNDYDRPSGRYTIASAMAHKEIMVDGVPYELIAIGVSGQGYNDEWLSNLSVGDEELHVGFADAADDLYDRFFGYTTRTGISERNLKVWVCGFSRSAAVSNLFAAAITDSEWFTADDVYAYTFATPRTTKDAKEGSYPNINNIVGTMDPVPCIPFQHWGYERFGNTYYTPSQETDSAWNEKVARVNTVYRKITGLSFWNSIQINSDLRVAMDYLLRIVPTAKIYSSYLEDRIIKLWENRSILNVMRTLFDISEDNRLINDSNRRAANELMDYLFLNIMSVMATDNETLGWDDRATTAANVVHEHTPDVYLAWLLSSDDPDEIYSKNLNYSIFSFKGDADLNVIRDGNLLYSLAAADNQSAVEEKNRMVVSSQDDDYTSLILPSDSAYTVEIVSHGDQTVEMTNIVFDTESFLYTYDESAKAELSKDETIQVSVRPSGEIDSERLLEVEIENAEDIISLFNYSTINVELVDESDYTWRQLTMFSAATLIFLMALIIFLFLAIFRVIFTKQLIKAGKRPPHTSAHIGITLSLVVTAALFTVMELYSLLYPYNTELLSQFRMVIVIPIIALAFYGYLKGPSQLHLFVFMGVTFLAAGDVCMTINSWIGLLMEWVGVCLLVYAYIQFAVPSKYQWIGFAVVASVSGLLLRIVPEIHSPMLSIVTINYFSVLILFFASLRLPRMFIRSSFLLFLFSLGLLFFQLYASVSLSSMFISMMTLLVFYLGLLTLILGVLHVIDLLPPASVSSTELKKEEEVTA